MVLYAYIAETGKRQPKWSCSSKKIISYFDFIFFNKLISIFSFLTVTPPQRFSLASTICFVNMHFLVKVFLSYAFYGISGPPPLFCLWLCFTNREKDRETKLSQLTAIRLREWDMERKRKNRDEAMKLSFWILNITVGIQTNRRRERGCWFERGKERW